MTVNSPDQSATPAGESVTATSSALLAVIVTKADGGLIRIGPIPTPDAAEAIRASLSRPTTNPEQAAATAEVAHFAPEQPHLSLLDAEVETVARLIDHPEQGIEIPLPQPLGPPRCPARTQHRRCRLQDGAHRSPYVPQGPRKAVSPTATRAQAGAPLRPRSAGAAHREHRPWRPLTRRAGRHAHQHPPLGGRLGAGTTASGLRNLNPARNLSRAGRHHPPAKEKQLNPRLIHELHQAAFYLPPDPDAPGEAVPVLGLAGARIASYITEDGELTIDVNSEEALSLLRLDADGHLKVNVRVDSRTAQTWSDARA